MKTYIISLLFLCTCSLFAQGKAIVFSDIEIDGPVKVELVQSDMHKVELLEEADLVSWEINGTSLVLTAMELKGHETPVVRIHVKEIKRLHLIGQVILEGVGTFEARRIYINLRNQSIANLMIDTEQLDVNLKHQCILTLSGAADQFTINANHQSILKATNLECATMDITANNQCVLTVNEANAKVNSKLNGYSVLTRN